MEVQATQMTVTTSMTQVCEMTGLTNTPRVMHTTDAIEAAVVAAAVDIILTMSTDTHCIRQGTEAITTAIGITVTTRTSVVINADGCESFEPASAQQSIAFALSALG